MTPPQERARGSQPAEAPQFPVFRGIELGDRGVIAPRLAAYAPVTSELTFAKLYAWRAHYRTRWSTAGEHLLFLLHADDPAGFALPPVGPPDRARVVRRLLAWMADEGGFDDPRIERADLRLIEELEAAGAGSAGGDAGLVWEPVREDFDYVYRRDDLSELGGRRFHAKRNHIHRAMRDLEPVYAPLSEGHVPGCLTLLADWCEARHCDDDLSLAGDREATRELLERYEELGLRGGVALVDGTVRAFSLGEGLNPTTAVVHAEKADPDMPALYAFINQRFAAEGLAGFDLVDREQDLGDEGLRRAKESYHPCRLEEKFRIRPA